MRPIAVILVVVAVLAAGLAAFLAKRWADSESARKDVDGPATAEVLVAAREISVGAVLQAGDIRYDKWPLSAASPRLLVRKGSDDPQLTVIGSVARFAMADGEPVTMAGIFKQDGAGLLAGMLGPGMRAVSVAITNPSAVSGFITPGDRVDVVLGADVTHGDNQASSDKIIKFASETVLENVRVLAIDQQFARGNNAAAIQGKTATLEVTAKQAELLSTAGLMGQLSLALRSIASPAVVDESGKDSFTPDTEASRALKSLHEGKPAAAAAGAPAPRRKANFGVGVKINRGGDVSSKSY